MKIIEGFRLRHVMGQATIVGEGAGQINFNKLVTLNPSAAYLWQSVENKEFTVEDLAGLLADHYGIPVAMATEDAARIAEEWMKNELVR